jgi:hypothetical protein
MGGVRNAGFDLSGCNGRWNLEMYGTGESQCIHTVNNHRSKPNLAKYSGANLSLKKCWMDKYHMGVNS